MQHKTLEQLEQELSKLNAALSLSGIDEGERNIYRAAIAEVESRIEATKRRGDQPPGNESPQGQGPIPVSVRRPIPVRNTNPAQPASITAVATAGARTVEINWGNDRRDILTEGDARSRFTTALRDLTQSRMARLGRFDDITQYLTFDRACAYYRALSVFWGGPPTPAQLQITINTTDRKTVFKMIQQHSNNSQHA